MIGAASAKTLAERLTVLPRPLAPLTLTILAFPLIMFTTEIMSVFYLTIFSAGFSDILLDIIKWHEPAEKRNILLSIIH